MKREIKFRTTLVKCPKAKWGCAVSVAKRCLNCKHFKGMHKHFVKCDN